MVPTSKDVVKSKAVGSTVYLPVKIEGTSVEALLDTGAQSMIISHSVSSSASIPSPVLV